MTDLYTARHACRALFLTPLMLLGGCSSLSALTGDSFTLQGQLPADFAIKAQAFYGVAEGCTGRSQAKSFNSGFHTEPQHYRFSIPVSYRSGLCEMRLARVKLMTEGRYGPQDWQQTYDHGSLVLVDRLPEGAPGFDANGVLTRQATCTWWFQISKLRLDLSKILNCKGDGAYLVGSELAGKTVRLNINVNPEEEPSHDDTWVKFPEGWKPCLPKEGWQSCQKPPVFQTFKMNGHECTSIPTAQSDHG